MRRWEIAERQRRKAARESSAVGGVSRRGTLLWQGKKSKVPPIGGLGTHTALQSRDNIDILPLRDINTSPTPSTSRSHSEDGHTADPFANPPDALSPFSDAHQPERPEAIPVSYENETPVSVYTNPPKASHPPPPKPLSLPPPRIFPPVATMTPISQSNPTYEDGNEHISQDTRWWHEWLCRCGEGPDRGGDNQVQAQPTFGEMYWSDCSFLLRPGVLILLSKNHALEHTKRLLSAGIAVHNCNEPCDDIWTTYFISKCPHDILDI